MAENNMVCPPLKLVPLLMVVGGGSILAVGMWFQDRHQGMMIGCLLIGILLLFFAMRMLRTSVSLDQDQLHYKGVFVRHTIPLSKIVKLDVVKNYRDIPFLRIWFSDGNKTRHLSFSVVSFKGGAALVNRLIARVHGIKTRKAD